MFFYICGGYCGGHKVKKRLTSQYLNSKIDAGKYYDDNGTGLFISVKESGSKSWGQKIRFKGSQLELGLGSYPATSLAEARRISTENKAMTAKGVNPKTERSKPTSIPTFSVIAYDVIKMKQESLTNAKHQAQWQSTLEVYAFPKIGNRPVNEITVNDIHDLLKPLWKAKTETASRLRGRIEKVFDYAIVKQMLPPPNPAVWKGNLSVLLPQKSKVAEVEHHPALRLEDTQRWWAELQQRDGIGAFALRFLTLAASRSGEIRGMHWDEIELFGATKARQLGYHGIWTCPAHRMKAKREHRVPIIKEMLEILLVLKKNKGLVFPSRNNTPLSDMTLSALMRRMHKTDNVGYIDAKSKRPAVPHGLRSTFRDWVAETGQSRESAELQLAHKFGGALEHTYYRTDLIDKRAELLSDWSKFLDGI